MDFNSNKSGAATAAHPDVRYYRVAKRGRPTDPQPTLMQADIEVWQRAVERAQHPGESISLDRVIERLDRGEVGE